jgi:hypothetical protein
MSKELSDKNQNRYKVLIEKIFLDNYQNDRTEIQFQRDDLISAAKSLDIKLPKNLGDVIYSLRYRIPMPERILSTQPEGMEWIID